MPQVKETKFIAHLSLCMAVSRMFVCVMIVFTLSSSLLGFQGTKEDYRRMEQQRSITRNKVFRTTVRPNWIFSETGMWYRVQKGPAEFEFVVVDVQAGKRATAFDHASVAKQLSKVQKREYTADGLPFQRIFLDKKLENVFIRLNGKAFQVKRSDSSLSAVDPSKIPAQNVKTAEAVRNSGPAEVSIHVTIQNQRKDSIRLFWIDQEGRTRSYGEVAGGQSKRQHTYVDHVWVVTDSRRNPLAIIRANANDEVFTITKESKVNTSFPARLGRRRNVSARSNRQSPDGKFRVEIRDHNVFLSAKEGDEIQLTKDGSDKNYFTGTCFWAPNSKKAIVLREEPGVKREIHMVESSPSGQLQPKLHTLSYTKPGDPIRSQKPYLLDVETRKLTKVEDTLFATPWRLSDFRWLSDSSEFQFLYNQRGHQVMRLVGIEAATGKAKAVVEDVVDTFIDYNYKFKKHFLPQSNELIWSSERDGWNHLYLYDLKTGKLKNQITKGKWLVRSIDRVDETKRQIWFQAGGIVPNYDPYYVFHCRIDFSGENLTVLNGGDGTHSIQYSPSRKYLIDTYSQVDKPAVNELRKVEDGRLICKLEEGDDSRLRKTGWQRPERFMAMGRDGTTPIFGVIYRPSNFDPEKKYPVIEYIYAGPHGSFVPKSYAPYRSTHALTELGFIVVQIDGMGTSNRSKAFHDICWKNLGDSGFPDRILWMKAAAKKYPYLDLTRVGIFGGSAGGQSALRALLAFGDFYKVAVSDCGCHDNRMDKIWWNEQWMGWPIGPHYKEQSNVTNAHRLKGKLFLIVGELDRNVDPASTMQVVDALIKANKDFDFLLVPGGGHGIGSRPYGRRRTNDFFVRHLLGVEPRAK